MHRYTYVYIYANKLPYYFFCAVQFSFPWFALTDLTVTFFNPPLYFAFRCFVLYFKLFFFFFSLTRVRMLSLLTLWSSSLSISPRTRVVCFSKSLVPSLRFYVHRSS